MEHAEEKDEVRGGGVSPWSTGVKVFLLCFSESVRFPCPDRSALKRQRETL